MYHSYWYVYEYLSKIFITVMHMNIHLNILSFLVYMNIHLKSLLFLSLFYIYEHTPINLYGNKCIIMCIARKDNNIPLFI